MLERNFQPKLIERILDLFPGCVVIKNNTNYIQGVPDLTVFYGDRYALLEVKANSKAKREPNQPYYVDLFNRMSFAAFVHPENVEDVLSALQRSFGTRRRTRRSEP